MRTRVVLNMYIREVFSGDHFSYLRGTVRSLYFEQIFETLEGSLIISYLTDSRIGSVLTIDFIPRKYPDPEARYNKNNKT